MKRILNSKFAALMLGVMIGAMAFGSVAFAASSDMRTLTAAFRGIQIEIDRIPFIPKDVNGNIVEPFIVDGTTYLPIRAISEALNKEVLWDNESNAVRIFTKSEPVIEAEVIETFTDVYLADKDTLQDFTVNSAILDSTNTWIVNYSVLPNDVSEEGSSTWIAGNGEYGENGWIVDKSFYVYVIKTYGIVELRVIGTGL